MRVLLAACVIAASACAAPDKEEGFTGSGSRSTFLNLDAEYVGDTACFDCHESEWRGFQEHGMAQSFYAMTPERSVEDWNASAVWHETSGYYYRGLPRGWNVLPGGIPAG